MKITNLVLVATCFYSSAVHALDYPVASCKSWDGTITGTRNLGTTNAEMVGKVTSDDILEYCRRQFRPDQINDCMNDNEIRVQTAQLYTIANCKDYTINFIYKDALNNYTTKANFRTKPQNLSCAGNLPPVIKQFIYLCPRESSEAGIDNWW